MNRRTWIILALLVLTAPARGQTAAVPPKLSPTGDMKWRITLQKEAVPPPPSPSGFDPATLDYEHSGAWTHLVADAGLPGSMEWWICRGYLLSRCNNGTGPVVVSRNGGGMPPAPYGTVGFYGVSRAKPGDEQGPASFQGVVCRHYHGDGYDAWFDATTGLPVAYREGSRTFLYHFFADAGPLLVPAEWQTALDSAFENLRRSGLNPP